MRTTTLAAHRFGFAETSPRALQADPKAWVLAQFPLQGANPNAMDTSGLGAVTPAARSAQQALRQAKRPAEAQSAERRQTERRQAEQALRSISIEGLQRRWQHTVSTEAPVAERWVQFWSNHFCVASTRASVQGLVWPHETEAIRPHAQGRFVDMLKASTLHPAMLLYLDNAQSVGPQSRVGQRRNKGLNENLARELLELHTLGVNGGYSQTDVTETARLLTGWTVDKPQDGGLARFEASLHQPGPKTILGKRYGEGAGALDALLADLTRHPSTGRHLATKLVRHFVTDDPPAAIVDAVASRFLGTEGDLRQTARALFEHPATWLADHPRKFKRPEELLLSAHRVLKLPFGQADLTSAYQAIDGMGQRPGRAPSPQGWPDRTDEWLSPDGLFKRAQWAERFAARHADKADARQLAQLSFADDLSESSRQQIERAESGAQALALFLMSPEFQWR